MISSNSTKSRAARSIKHMRGDPCVESTMISNLKPVSECNYKYRRSNIYHNTHDEVMAWAKTALKTGLIKKPRGRKPYFPYFLEQYIKYLKQNRGDSSDRN